MDENCVLFSRYTWLDELLLLLSWFGVPDYGKTYSTGAGPMVDEEI